MASYWLAPLFPDVVLAGRAVFEWHESGAFLLVRAEIDHPKFPDGIEIFGSDDAAKSLFMGLRDRYLGLFERWEDAGHETDGDGVREVVGFELH